MRLLTQSAFPRIDLFILDCAVIRIPDDTEYEIPVVPSRTILVESLRSQVNDKETHLACSVDVVELRLHIALAVPEAFF